MADIDFKVTSGAYAGRYSLDMGDLTASDIGDLIAAGGPDLDAALLTPGARPGIRVFAGLVWIVKRHGSSKGLAYRAVADAINVGNVEDASEEPAEAGANAGLPDPSPSAADS